MSVPVVVLMWTLIVAAIVAAATRPWRSSEYRAQLAILLAVAGAAWPLVNGAISLTSMMDDGQWTGASITIGLIPLKAVVLSLLAYTAALTFLGARGGADLKKYVRTAALGAVIVWWIADDYLAMQAAVHERHAASAELNSAEVAAVADRVRSGKAGSHEAYAFLRNPLCPPDILTANSDSPDVYARTAIASNTSIGPALAAKLAGDADEQVRKYLAVNRNLPPDVLAQLAADSSGAVRKGVVWAAALPDYSFNRMVDDPSPEVRVAVAAQSRLTAEQVEKLKNDPLKEVREAAIRRWGE